MRREMIFGILLIFAGLILSICADLSFATDAGDPYSSQPSTGAGGIGAWYDETWQASGFFRLTQIGASDNYRYEYTTTPTTSFNPTFVRDGTTETKTTDEGGTPQHEHDYRASPASLPQDIIVTEWKVVGHVHFSSGM